MILFIFLLYILLTVFLSNGRFVGDTLLGSFPLFYKSQVLFFLSLGIFTAFSPVDTIITLLSGLFVGINLTLLIKTLYLLEHQGKIGFSVGGATIIGLVSSGCASCGLSVLSLLGLSASLSFLPFHGLEIHLLSLVLLIISSWYMIKKLRDGVYCKIK